MMHHVADRRGVALLEVLLAVTIVGIGLGAVFNSFSTSTRISSWMGREALARELASAQLFRLHSAGALNAVGESRGSFKPPYSDYGWLARVQSPPGLVSRITLEVTYGEKSERIYSIQTYQVKPSN